VSDKQQSSRRRSLGGSVLVIATVLIPLNVYWVIRLEALPDLAHSTELAIFFTAVFTLLMLVSVNWLVRLLVPRFALSQAQLLLIYSMVCIGSALGGCDMIQKLVPAMSWSFWMANPTNKYDVLFNPDMPKWATVQDLNILRGFYEGGVSPYQSHILAAWLGPIALWTLFIIGLVTVMLCLNVLIRRRWLDEEHLACPLVYLPVEISSPRASLFRHKLFWLGFGAAAAVKIWNRAAFLYPAIPTIQLEPVNMATGFKSAPWNAIRTLPRSFFPFAIGLGYLMPSDFLFSLWFFYLFWKAQLVLAASFGLSRIRDFPFDNFQCFGAYVLFGIYTLWLERDYLRELYKAIVGAPSRLRDEPEPLSYRSAIVGTILGLIVLVWFSRAIGMSLWLIILFFIIYYVLAVAITRMRAQFAVPIHSVHHTGASNVLPTIFGTRFLPKKDLIGMAVYFWFNRAYRSHPMPFQLEGMKMQQLTAGTMKGTAAAFMGAAIIGILSAFWTHLHLCYSLGATAKGGLGMWGGPITYDMLTRWVTVPEGPRLGPIVAIGAGGLFALFLQVMRTRFVNWPFHPLAYTISACTQGQMINNLWMPLFLAWIIKSAIIRYGGHKVYRLCLPIFLGLILGEFAAGSMLNLGSFALGLPRPFAYWVP